jgi:hypothetical protein
VRSERNRRIRRLVLVIAILGAATVVVFPWVRDQNDPLWRVRRAFEEIEVPGQWQLVHQEEVDERFLHPWGGAVPEGKRIYFAGEEPRRACRTSAEIVAAWSNRHIERVRVVESPIIPYSCQGTYGKDQVVATFTVWDSDGWRSQENRPDLGRPIGDGISVVELDVESY